MKINPNAPTFVQWKTRPFAKIALLRPSLRTFLWNLARLFVSLWSLKKMSFEILRLGHQRSKGKKLSRLSNGVWLHFFFWVIKIFKIFTWFEVLKELSVVAEKLSIKKRKINTFSFRRFGRVQIQFPVCSTFLEWTRPNRRKGVH